MSNIKTFLKALNKSGYPNGSPDVPTIAYNLIDYHLTHFLQDLVDNVGMKGADDFVEKTFSSLGLMGEGLKIDLSNEAGEEGSYIYLIINSFDIELSDSDEPDEVWIHYSWGEDKLIHDGEEKTLEILYDEVDLGTMGEYDEFITIIQDTCQSDVYKKTGFIIHFDSQI
jgi:hypothetical protein